MKRTDYITRTMSQTVVTVLVADPIAEQMMQETVILEGAVNDTEKVKKLIAEMPGSKVVVKIIELTTCDKLMAMLKSDFMRHAFEIDAKGNKIGQSQEELESQEVAE